MLGRVSRAFRGSKATEAACRKVCESLAMVEVVSGNCEQAIMPVPYYECLCSPSPLSAFLIILMVGWLGTLFFGFSFLKLTQCTGGRLGIHSACQCSNRSASPRVRDILFELPFGNLIKGLYHLSSCWRSDGGYLRESLDQCYDAMFPIQRYKDALASSR